MEKIYLESKNSSQKSFYKKAFYIKETEGNKTILSLYSYEILVLKIVLDNDEIEKSFYITNYYTDYSNTTLKHVKEMILQFLPDSCKAWEVLSEKLTKSTIMQNGIYEE